MPARAKGNRIVNKPDAADLYNQLVEKRGLINPIKPPFLTSPENHAEHDLNWAVQQIRETGKPAGDVEKYNEQATWILESATGMPAAEAGLLIGEYLRLRRAYMQPFWEKAVRDRGHAMKAYRDMEEVLCFSYE
jgi:hypothetical protein